MSEPFVCLRDDDQIRIVVFKKGRGDQEILTSIKTARLISKKIIKALKEKESTYHE